MTSVYAYPLLFIGGRRVAPVDGHVITVVSPHDASVVGTAALAGPGDIDQAVAIARDAFDNGPWPKMTPRARAEVLGRFSELHAAQAEEIAQLVTRENGSPLWFTRLLQGALPYQNQAYLDAAASYPWEIELAGQGSGKTLWRREPSGVVAAVIPWNAPHQSALVKLFPALLAGCTVVLKLAVETALDGQLLGELFNQAGYRQVC